MGAAHPRVSPLDLPLRERSVGSYASVIISYLEEGLFHDEAGDGATDIPGYDVSPLQGMMGMKGLLLFKMAEGVQKILSWFKKK